MKSLHVFSKCRRSSKTSSSHAKVLEMPITIREIPLGQEREAMGKRNIRENARSRRERERGGVRSRQTWCKTRPHSQKPSRSQSWSKMPKWWDVDTDLTDCATVPGGPSLVLGPKSLFSPPTSAFPTFRKMTSSKSLYYMIHSASWPIMYL